MSGAKARCVGKKAGFFAIFRPVVTFHHPVDYPPPTSCQARLETRDKKMTSKGNAKHRQQHFVPIKGNFILKQYCVWDNPILIYLNSEFSYKSLFVY